MYPSVFSHRVPGQSPFLPFSCHRAIPVDHVYSLDSGFLVKTAKKHCWFFSHTETDKKKTPKKNSTLLYFVLPSLQGTWEIMLP